MSNKQDEFQQLESSLAEALQYLPLTVELLNPPPECKTALFQKIRKQSLQQSRSRVLLPQTGFAFIPDNDDDGWFEHSDSGVMVKTLAKNPVQNYVVLLMKLAPGAVLHEHKHSGSEQCYVLEGSVQVQGNILYAGDFHQADAKSVHNPIVSPTGAKLLLIVGKDDYNKAYWGFVGTTVGSLAKRLKDFTTKLFFPDKQK